MPAQTIIGHKHKHNEQKCSIGNKNLKVLDREENWLHLLPVCSPVQSMWVELEPQLYVYGVLTIGE